MALPHSTWPAIAFVGMSAILLNAGLSPGHAAPLSVSPNRPAQAHVHRKFHHRIGDVPIDYVVVVVQENRSVDNLFNGFCIDGNPNAGYVGCALTVNSYMGQPLTKIKLYQQNDDPGHYHTLSPGGNFVQDYDGGANDGWTSSSPYNALTYVRQSDTQIYDDLASQWQLSDYTFQSNEGPSFVAHQYLIAGQSGGIPNNGNGYSPNLAPWAQAENPGFYVAGCPAVSESFIKMTTTYPGTQTNKNTCVDYPTILDEATAAYGNSAPAWKFYVPTVQEIWDAPCGVEHIYNANLCNKGGSANVVVDSTGSSFQTDVANGKLAHLTYIIPCTTWSDHPPFSSNPPPNPNETGPNWVNFIANTIGKSQYWGLTTIIVVWDDWGGWYDHVVPYHTPSIYPSYYNNLPPGWTDPNEYGYRVPMLVISPYLRAPSTVDHYPNGFPSEPPRTQASILGYIENTLGLGSLNAADAVSDNLSEMFNYNRTPLNYTKVDPTQGFPSPQADCTDNTGNDFEE
jgi:hypothetical protein